jgi:tRNA(fMet)-specific endonuclease VapC
MIVVDTDVLIEILDKKSTKGAEALEHILKCGEDIGTAVINMHELLYGLNKYAKPTEDVLLLPVLTFTEKDAILSSKLELEAEKKGTPNRRTDAMVAAVTINNNATLYTFDQKHFTQFTKRDLKLFK